MADQLLAYLDSRAQDLGIPVPLARALVAQESGGNPDAVSYKGARSIMQVMPGTMRQMGYDPATATQQDYIDAGLGYLKGNYDRFGAWDQAVAAYHAGPGAVAAAGGIPNTSDGLSTTANYTRNIMSRAGQLPPGQPPGNAPPASGGGLSLADYLASQNGTTTDGASNRPASSDISLSDYLSGLDLSPPEPESSNFVRGAKVALGQTMPLVKGVVGLVGATAEKALGTGGMATAVKDWGFNGYKEGMDKLQPLQKDTDELTTAWDQAKQGDLGAMLKWAEYSLGYAVGQGGEAAATSMLGAVVGGAASGGLGAAPGAIAGMVAKGAVKDLAGTLIEKAVAREAISIASASGGTISTEAAIQQATKNIAKNIGSTSALLAYSNVQELGSIYPDAVDQGHKEGRELDGSDLARVWASGIVAGGIEGLTDKLGIEAAMGRVKIPGATSRVGSAALTGLAGAATEGGTEAVQTAIEHYGAGQPIADAEGMKDIINSAGQGALGGAAIGGGAGLIHGGHSAGPDAHAAAAKAVDDIATAKTPDEAITAFQSATVPVTVQPQFDAQGAMARMARATQADAAAPAGQADLAAMSSPEAVQRTIDNITQGAQTPTTPDAAAAAPAPTAIDKLQAGVPQTFQERLAVVRQQLDDSRVQQMLKDTGGPEMLHDAQFMASQADNTAHAGATSDQMLAHAERLLTTAGVPPLADEVLSQHKAQQAAQSRADAEAKAAEAEKKAAAPAPAPAAAPPAAAPAATGALETATKAEAKQKLDLPHNATDADMTEAARAQGVAAVNFTDGDGQAQTLAVPGALTAEPSQTAAAAPAPTLKERARALKTRDQGKPDTTIQEAAPQVSDRSQSGNVTTSEHALEAPKPSMKERAAALAARSQQQAGDIVAKATGKPFKTMPAAMRALGEAGGEATHELVKVKDGLVVRAKDDRASNPASSASKDSASWVVRERATGKVMFETFDRAKVDALNTAKYEAVPIKEYLPSLNKRAAGAQEQTHVQTDGQGIQGQQDQAGNERGGQGVRSEDGSRPSGQAEDDGAGRADRSAGNDAAAVTRTESDPGRANADAAGPAGGANRDVVHGPGAGDAARGAGQEEGQAQVAAERIQYPTTIGGKNAPAYLAPAQRAVVDFMNGDIDKPGLVRKFADLGMTEGQVSSVTDRIADHGWTQGDAWAVQRAQGRIAKTELADDPNIKAGTSSIGGLDAVRAKWDAAGIAHSMSEKGDTISLDKIMVPKDGRQQGAGAAAMRQLTAYADANGKRIELTPSTDFGATSTSRLRDFYKQFGFVENKGRNKDFTTRAGMLREPQSNLQAGTEQRITNPDRTRQGSIDATAKPMSTATGAASQLAQSGSKDWVRQVASTLVPYLDKDTPVRYLRAGEMETVPHAIAQEFAKGGIFGVNEVDSTTGKSSVYMLRSENHPVGEEDLLHELTHAATQRALSVSRSEPIRAQLESIRTVLTDTLARLAASPAASEEARSQAEFFRSVITDEHELLAYGTSSGTFREWAKSMDVNGRFLKPDAAPRPTLWQRFVDTVRGLLGMSKLYTDRLDALLSGGDPMSFRTTNTPANLHERLDQLLRQTLDQRVSPAEYVAEVRDGAPNIQPGIAATIGNLRSMDQQGYRNAFNDFMRSDSKVNFWRRTVGTQYDKAEANPTTFKPVFEAGQDYLKDTSNFANAAADHAPDLLPKLNQMSDVWKNGIRNLGAKAEDVSAAGGAVWAGTLKYTRDQDGKLVTSADAERTAAGMTPQDKAQAMFKAGLVTEAELKRWLASPLDIYDGAVRNRYEDKVLRPGVVFSDAELRSEFHLSDHQIDLYRQFRATTDQSLEDLGRSEIVRLAGKDVGDEVRQQAINADTLAQASQILVDQIDKLTEAEDSPSRRQNLIDLRNSVIDKENRIDQLKKEGYAPLMRFGEHVVDVVGANGQRIYFGMYESNTAANMAARSLKAEYPDATITQSRMSKEASRLYQGINLHSLELFASETGNADNQIYQQFLQLTKNNRSALKRLIERKGIAGYNENAQRVLASFVTSNAKQASGNMHMQRMVDAAAAIPQDMGQIKDEAIKLVNYLQSSQNEAPALRGLLFTNFIGGSVASSLVNLTQPFTMTMPFLTQYGGIAKAGAAMLSGTKQAATGKVMNPLVAKAMLANADIVSPQEIHSLQAATQDSLANHPMLQKAAFIWGSMFQLSEQFNRRSTFIAAYETALREGMADPTAFARKAVIETQGLYNKGNKPNLARGALGATVMTFKQFSINYLEFLNRMARSGPQGKKAVGVALAMLVLASGTNGLPFADDLNDMIDTLAQALGYDFSTKRAIRKFIASTLGDGAADFLTRGASGAAGMPIDISVRMGMGNLIPATGIFLKSDTDRSKDVMELAGAAGAMGQSVLNAGTALLQGDPGKAVQAILPNAIQNMVKAADMLNTGSYRDSKGRLVIQTGTFDAAVKFLGFQPSAIAKETMLVSEAQTSIQLAKVVESQIVAKWATGLNENDPDKVQAARQDLADWNANNDAHMKITMQQVIGQVRQMRTARVDRVVKSAPSDMRQGIRQDISP